MKTADIDIDFVDPAKALEGLQHVPATMNHQEGRARHPTSVYFQDIPADPLDGMAVWDYEEAATRGYFKVDFCKSKLYEGIRDEIHLDALLNRAPPWHLFRDRAVVAQLNQLHNHFDAVEKIEPESMEELAVCISIIRPAKRYLLKRPRFEIMRDIWLPENDVEEKYKFKRSHALAYAASLVVQLNLLVEQQKV